MAAGRPAGGIVSCGCLPRLPATMADGSQSDRAVLGLSPWFVPYAARDVRLNCCLLPRSKKKIKLWVSVPNFDFPFYMKIFYN